MRWVVFATLAACSSPEAMRDACPAVVQEPLVNATTNESFLGLSSGEIQALVRITPADAAEGLCSGTFVRQDWVLTARHCLVIEAPEVTLIADDGKPSQFAVLESVPHPDEDVALLNVDGSSAVQAGMIPIPEARPRSHAPSSGDLVELAGYGTTETGSSHELRFLVEPIVDVDNASFVVSGFGATGACNGDSGGPALTRDATGHVVVAGVLSSGSITCVDDDRYVRADKVEAWMKDRLGLEPPSRHIDPCAL